MNDLLDPEAQQNPEVQQNRQFSKGGLYVKEDDQDWGSAGMNDVQKDSE